MTVQNTSRQVVAHPLALIELPIGVRFKSVVSAPPGTAMSVTQTDRETVELVLPFTLVPQESLELVIETTPMEEIAPQQIRVRALPMEERLRAAPQTTRSGVTTTAPEALPIRQHLHPHAGR